MRRHRHHLKPEQHARLSTYLRENPAMEAVYRFKQKLCYLLLNKRLNQNKCRELAPKLLRMIALLREQPLPHMVQLGNTLHCWREEIATMLRIPLKANAFPEGSRAGFRDDSEHRSERSDAGLSIVQEVFGFVKMLRIRSAAED
jgi:transposase